jgi:predicted fused transcriptional regulator/phosphomethylpyrimidine kinase
METMIDLISDKKKEIKRLESLVTYERAHEFVNKRNEKIKKNENKFLLLEDADYNNDNIPDTVVTKGGKVYSFNVYLTKDTEFPFRNKFGGTDTDKYDTGRKNKNKKPIMMYPKYKKSSIVSPVFNANSAHPRHIKCILNTTFDDATVNQYPSIQKYYSKANSNSHSTTYSVIPEIVS